MLYSNMLYLFGFGKQWHRVQGAASGPLRETRQGLGPVYGIAGAQGKQLQVADLQEFSWNLPSTAMLDVKGSRRVFLNRTPKGCLYALVSTREHAAERKDSSHIFQYFSALRPSFCFRDKTKTPSIPFTQGLLRGPARFRPCKKLPGRLPALPGIRFKA